MSKLWEIPAGQLTGEYKLRIQHRDGEIRIGQVNSADYVSIVGTVAELREVVAELDHVVNYAEKGGR